MSQCVYCHQRKGKRSCPALSGLICSQCCGEHRLTRISCPPDCAYLETGSDYQQKRLGEQVVTFGYFHDRRDGQDAEVIAAIQALRRSLSPLHVPSAPMPVFAERLKKEYDTFAKQNPQQIADLGSAPEILDRALALISEFSGPDFQSRRFLNGMIG